MMLLSCSFIYGQTEQEIIERSMIHLDWEAFNEGNPDAMCGLAMYRFGIYIHSENLIGYLDDIDNKMVDIEANDLIFYFGDSNLEEVDIEGTHAFAQMADTNGYSSVYGTCMETILAFRDAMIDRVLQKEPLPTEWNWAIGAEQIFIRESIAAFAYLDPKSRCELARMYAYGYHVDKDPDEALRLAQMADSGRYISPSGETCTETITAFQETNSSDSFLNRVWNWMTGSEENNSNSL